MLALSRDSLSEISPGGLQDHMRRMTFCALPELILSSPILSKQDRHACDSPVNSPTFESNDNRTELPNTSSCDASKVQAYQAQRITRLQRPDPREKNATLDCLKVLAWFTGADKHSMAASLCNSTATSLDPLADTCMDATVHMC